MPGVTTPRVAALLLAVGVVVELALLALLLTRLLPSRRPDTVEPPRELRSAAAADAEPAAAPAVAAAAAPRVSPTIPLVASAAALAVAAGVCAGVTAIG